MDENGNWWNEFGRITKKNIIRYFNRSIKKDPMGFYLTQTAGNRREKVYFSYIDTAWFAVDLRARDKLNLLLNTQEEIQLEPDRLYIKNDALFMQFRDAPVKFRERVMIKLSKYLTTMNDKPYITIDGVSHQIAVTGS